MQLKNLFFATLLLVFTSSTFAMPTDIRENNEMLTKALNTLYWELMVVLKKESPELAVKLKASEKEWIKFRDLNCEFEGLAGKHDIGWGEPWCQNRFLYQRIKEIKRYRDFFIPEEKRKQVILP